MPGRRLPETKRMTAQPDHHRLPAPHGAVPAAWAGAEATGRWQAGPADPGWVGWQSGLDAPALARTNRALQSTSRATLLGAPDGEPALVVFIDYQCRASRQLCASLQALQQHDDRLRVLLRHLPQRGPVAAQAAQLVLGVPAGITAARVHRYLVAAPVLDMATLQAAEARFRLVPAPLGQANEALADSQALAARLGISTAPAVVAGARLWRGAASLAVLEEAVRQQRQRRHPGSAAWHRFWRSGSSGP